MHRGYGNDDARSHDSVEDLPAAPASQHMGRRGSGWCGLGLGDRDGAGERESRGCGEDPTPADGGGVDIGHLIILPEAGVSGAERLFETSLGRGRAPVKLRA